MHDDWNDESYEYETNDESNEGGTIWRVLYIFIVFLIIMGLISPNIYHILQGRQSSNRSNSNEFVPSPQVEPPDQAEVEAEQQESDEDVSIVEEVPAVEEETAVPEETQTENALEESVTELDLSINRIALITIDQQVATINPDGSDLIVLTSGDEQYQFPAWSPDGQFLASISTSGGRGKISLIEDDADATPRSVYSSVAEPPFYLYWAPNSQFISFLAENNDTPMALHLLDIAAEQIENQKIATGGPFYWHWGANSDNLLIHSGASGVNARLELISSEGEKQREDIASPGFFQVPMVSVDGRFMAYAALGSGGSSEIIIEDLNSAELQKFRHNGLTALSWNPEKNLLAYTSTPEPDVASFIGPLRILDAETGDTTLLTDSFVLAYFWSPNGRYIAYFTLSEEPQNEEFNAQFLNLMAGRGAGLSKPDAQFDIPDFQLTIVDVETGVGQIVMTDFVPSFTFISQFMPFFDQYALSHSLWSPNSDAFLVPYLVDSLPKIAVVTPDGSRPRDLADGRIAFWSRQ